MKKLKNFLLPQDSIQVVASVDQPYLQLVQWDLLRDSKQTENYYANFE